VMVTQLRPLSVEQEAAAGVAKPPRMRRTTPSPFRTETIDLDQAFGRGVVGLDLMDPRIRSFLILRTRLQTSFYRAGGRMLVVSSTETANGKTYVSANLACATAAIQPCVLVDLDLRRPSIAHKLGLTVERGVDDFLSGEAEFEEVGIALDGLDLTVFPARTPRFDSSNLLAGDLLGSFLRRVRELPGSPICIIDTPPTLVLDDVMLISRRVDGVLMVVEEGRTRSADLKEALGLFGSTPLVGSVLNKSLSSNRGYDTAGFYQKP
jgi:protein-tyrosine kinase